MREGEPDLPEEVVRGLPSFVGRDQIFRAVDTWLSSGGRRLVVMGLPGTGKSLFCGRLVTRWYGDSGYPVLGAWHFFQARRDSTLTVGRVVERMVDHLARHVDGFGAALRDAVRQESTLPEVSGTAQVSGSVGAYASVSGVSVHVHLGDGLAAAVDGFDRLVRKPLAAMRAAGTLPAAVVLIFDGLDEAVSAPLGDALLGFVDAISGPDCELPEQVRFVLTSRPDGRVERRLGHPDIAFDPSTDLADVTAYARRELERLHGGARAGRAAARLATSGGANFLYVHYALADLADVETADLPQGLDAQYREFLTRELTRADEAWEERYRPVLGVLSAAQEEGFTAAELAGITGLAGSRVDDALLRLRAYLLATADGRWYIYHRSFTAFLAGEATYPVYRDEADDAIVDWYRRQHDGDWLAPGTPAYATRALAINASRVGRLTELISQPTFLVAVEPEVLAVATARYDSGDEAINALVRADLGRLRGLPAPERLAYLEMTADQVGAVEMASALRRLDAPGRPWSVRWSSWNRAAGSVVGAHAGAIRNVVVVERDGRPTAVCGDEAGDLRCWDLASGEAGAPVPTGASLFHFPVAELDGELVAIVGGPWSNRTMEASVWSLDSGRRLGVHVMPGKPVAAVSEAGGVLVVTRGSWEAVSIGHLGGDLSEIELPASEFRPDSTRQVIGSLDGCPVVVHIRIAGDRFVLDVVDLRDGRLLETRACRPYKGGDDVEFAALVHLDGEPVIVAAFTDWDLATDLKAWRLRDGELVWATAFEKRYGWPIVAAGDTPDGFTVAVATESSGFTLFEVAAGAVRRRTLLNDGGSVAAMAIARVGERTVVVTGGMDGKLRVWDADAGGDPAGDSAGTGRVHRVARARDALVATRLLGDGTATLECYALADGGRRPAMGLPRPGEICPVPDGGSPAVVVVDEAGVAVARPPVLEPRWRWLRRADWRGDLIPIRYAVGSPAGRPVVAIGHLGHDDRVADHGLGVEVFDLRDGRPVGPVAGDGQPGPIALGGHGGRLVVAYESNGFLETPQVSAWDVTTGEPIGRPLPMTTARSHNSFGSEVVRLAVRADDERLVLIASNSYGEVRLWDPHEPDGVVVYRPHIGIAAATELVRVGGDTYLVTGDGGGALRLWRRDGEQVRRIDVGAPVTDLARVDGRGLAVGTRAGLMVIDLYDALTDGPDQLVAMTYSFQ
ncbi:hypothetical protein ACIBSW_24500 [Actinoplanes sp. NPDC049668]|uniref:hypothetical protein n=1 Tax=unclassified Actinoplanes TaxID=2626549 RepID=UPI0033AC0118